MGYVLLIISAVIEIVLAVFCFRTRSNQKKIRSWVRIAELTLFVIFVLVSVIEWSFRWYILAAILLVSAIIGGVSLMLKKKEKEFGPVRIVLKGIALWLVVAIAVIPALVFPQYKLPEVTGKYKVETVAYTYTDNNRIETFNNLGQKRKANIKFWYPATQGQKFPLVVFSHGAFGIRDSNTSTFMELASNGYIVCSIDHPYHSLYTLDTDGKFTMVDSSFMQEVKDVNNGVYDDETAYKLEQKWLKVRTDDMNFVLDTIIKNSADKGSGQVYQLIDSNEIGLIGHSLGGAASVQLGRERKDIDAVINLDADLLGEVLGIENGKAVINHEIYPVPLLSIYSDTMKKLMDDVTDPDVVIPQKLISATAPNAYEVDIKGTNHMSLTDLPLVSPVLANMINGSVKNSGSEQKADKYYVIYTMNKTVRKFFDSYLKGKGSFDSAGTY
ncbi:alpha/beta hydrolase family protein [Paenibacillus sp. SN-8-1]|uniref:alpha/beta hydrolase family protein n=1 Tax=Paenibacillus sp. SN-8-1 TaxID=3435409 RepID=UPI003D9A5D57